MNDEKQMKLIRAIGQLTLDDIRCSVNGVVDADRATFIAGPFWEYLKAKPLIREERIAGLLFILAAEIMEWYENR